MFFTIFYYFRNYEDMGVAHTERLNGVHPDLCRVVYRASELAYLKGIDITVAEGLRSKGRQQQLFELGKSKTLNSKHLIGEAVDIYPIIEKKIAWDRFSDLALCMFQAAYELSVPVEWGGDWKMRDCPHWQLSKVVEKPEKSE